MYMLVNIAQIIRFERQILFRSVSLFNFLSSNGIAYKMSIGRDICVWNGLIDFIESDT